MTIVNQPRATSGIVAGYPLTARLARRNLELDGQGRTGR